MVFLGSSCRETAKNAIKKKSMGKDERKKVFFPQLFRPKVFDMYFPQKVFYGVFEPPLLRNAQKRWVKTKGEKKNLNFFGQKFLTCISPKSFLWCFRTPLVEKRTKALGKDERGGKKISTFSAKSF